MSNLMNQMQPQIAKRGREAPASPIRKLVPLALKAKSAGKKIYHLNIGQPDFTVPESAQRKLKEVATLDYLPYTESFGNKELIESWQKYFSQNGIETDFGDILVTSGASEAIIFTLGAICDSGSEFIVFEPFYANYLGFANLVSAIPVPVALNVSDSYHLPRKEEITKKITGKTRAIFVASPNNPTGTVLRQSEIEMIIDLARKHNLFIISDETYYGLSFDDHKSISFLEVAAGKDLERIVVIDSLSKKFNLCGLRIGVMASKNKEVMSAANRFAQERLSVGFLDQLVARDVLGEGNKYITKLAGEYKKRRDIFIETLSSDLNIDIAKPEGAFYTFIKLPINNSDSFARWLLGEFNDNNETVMIAPGSGFYATPGLGQDEIRVAYVLEEEKLKRAAQILAKAVRKYQDSMLVA